MIPRSLCRRVLVSSLLATTLTSVASASADAYVTTELAYPGGPGYQELTTDPYALSVSGLWTSTPGVVGSARAFSSIPQGKLGGAVDLNTLDYTGSTVQKMLSEVEQRETLTVTGSGSDLKEFVFKLHSTATFALSTPNGSGRTQWAEFSTRFSAFNLSPGNTTQTARFLYEYSNGSWSQYLDSGNAEVKDLGFHEDYIVDITARVMARPGDKIGVYADLYGYLESKKTHPSIDFAHTATISVAAPAGYGFTSTSGVFLTQAVPEPGTFVALGLGAVALLRRRTRR